MKEDIAKIMLEKKAVTLSPKEPYTFVSGIRSPIYCDNRVLIGFVQDRKKVVSAFIQALDDIEFDVVAGTSTAGIPWAAWIAEELGVPMAYIRGGKKEHGKGKQIEGAPVDGKKVVIIEDMISTGGSSFSAVQAARDEGAVVEYVVSLFSYEFEKAAKKFEEGNCGVKLLSDFTTLANVAEKEGLLSSEELEVVLDWNKAPADWGPKHGFPNRED